MTNVQRTGPQQYNKAHNVVPEHRNHDEPDARHKSTYSVHGHGRDRASTTGRPVVQPYGNPANHACSDGSEKQPASKRVYSVQVFPSSLRNGKKTVKLKVGGYRNTTPLHASGSGLFTEIQVAKSMSGASCRHDHSPGTSLGRSAARCPTFALEGSRTVCHPRRKVAGNHKNCIAPLGGSRASTTRTTQTNFPENLELLKSCE